MKKILVVLLAVAIFVPAAVTAAVLKANGEISMRSSEVINDDVYVAGGSINTAATVVGDLVIAGGNLFLAGSTTQDVIAAGGTITVAGPVGDDARIAGGNLTLSGSVKDDVIIAGGQINIVSTSIIGGDLIATGGNIVIDGDVRGRVEVTGGNVVLNGLVTGTVVIRADKITIGEQAVVIGKVSYSSPQKAEIKEGSQLRGGVEFKQVQRASDVSTRGFGIVIKFLILAVTALLLQLLLGKIAVRITSDSAARPWRNLGIGFLALVATPIAAILLVATIIGLPLGILLFLAYAASLLFSCLFVPIFVGAVAWKYFKKSDMYILDWKTALIGAFITVVFGAVPFIGGLFVFITLLIVLGALVQLKGEYLKKLR